MIGIPILDNLSDEDLVKVANGNKIIRIIRPSSVPITSIEYNPDLLVSPIKEMDNEIIITLCKMEIESRLGWMYLRELIDSKENK